tara:strand:- start:1131 stop:1253 length:123 start_codon:yes stop_codon:yes gene_type:complete
MKTFQGVVFTGTISCNLPQIIASVKDFVHNSEEISTFAYC